MTDFGNYIPRNYRANMRRAVRAEGIYIYDESGKAYIDGCSGALISSFGHGNREIIEAVTVQLENLEFCHPSRWRNAPAETAAAELASIAPGDLDYVWFVSGGSEAVESAMKMARQFFVERDGKGTSKYVVVGRWNSYHGSTLGTMGLAGSMARRRTFAPMFTERPKIASHYCYRCPFGLEYPSCSLRCAKMLEDTIQQIGPQYVAAFIAEPVVGSTVGALDPPDEYWPMVREICDRYDVLLVADEVMTGIGRTGEAFGVDNWKVVPDVIACAKAVSGGYIPAGAMIARKRIMEAIINGSGHFEHGHTYNGNPVTGAAVTAALRYMKEHDLITNASIQGNLLGKRLAELGTNPIVGDIRGLGMMRGIEIVMDKGTREPFPADMNAAGIVAEECMKNGLVVYPGRGMINGISGDQFMVAPPLICGSADIEEIASRLAESLLSSSRILFDALKWG